MLAGTAEAWMRNNAVCCVRIVQLITQQHSAGENAHHGLEGRHPVVSRVVLEENRSTLMLVKSRISRVEKLAWAWRASVPTTPDLSCGSDLDLTLIYIPMIAPPVIK